MLSLAVLRHQSSAQQARMASFASSSGYPWRSRSTPALVRLEVSIAVPLPWRDSTSTEKSCRISSVNLSCTVLGTESEDPEDPEVYEGLEGIALLGIVKVRLGLTFPRLVPASGSARSNPGKTDGFSRGWQC